MTSEFSFLQEFVVGKFALSQVLSVFLFAFMLLTVISFARYYIPKEIDSSFKVLLILGAAVTVSYFSYFAYVLPVTDLFLNVALSLSLGVCLLHPSLALANLVGYLILRPWELLERAELAVLPRTFLLLFLISLVFNYFQNGRIRINTSRQQLMIIALGAWVFLSTLVSGDIPGSQSVFFDNFLKSIIVAVFIFQTIQKEEDYNLFTNMIVLAVLSVSIFALINTYFIAQTDRLEGRGSVQNANDLAALLIFVLPLSLRSLFRKQIVIPAIVVSLIVMSILALGVWKAQSRASYVSIMLMGMTFFVYQFRHRRALLLQLGAIAVVGFIAISQSSLGRDDSDISESKMNRLGYWEAGISMALRNPLLGVGFDQFPKNYTMYGAADFTESGHRTAHSSWILLLSEAGFPAFALMAFLFYQAALKSWSLFKSAPELLLMLVGYGVCMTFLSHTYLLYPYILLALIFTYPVNHPTPQEEFFRENPVA
jgi:O-antigen ligase